MCANRLEDTFERRSTPNGAHVSPLPHRCALGTVQNELIRRSLSRTASRLSIRRATRSRARSVAPAATSTPPSMDCSGIWSRTALAATLWTTDCSRTSRTLSPTSGTAAIPTCPPSAGRARRNTSGGRRTTTICTLRIWCSTFAACLRGPIAGACRATSSRRHRSAASNSSSARRTSSASRFH